MKLADAPLREGRDPQGIRPEIPESGTFPETEKVVGEAKEEKSYYYILTARQCQALAAANAVWGNILDEESELAAVVVGRGRTPRARAAAVQSDLLRYAALSERNRAAAEALELFYRLAEAEAHWDICRAALELIEEAEKEKGGSESGASSGSELSKSKDSDSSSSPRAKSSEGIPSERWEAERGRWEHRQQEAARRIEQLNSRLRPMLGGEVGDFRRIWPVVSLRVTPQKVHVERAVQQGLAERAELRALRRLLRGIDANDLSAVRHALEQWHPALGSTPSRFPALAQALGTAPQHMEAITREEQIRFLLTRREKEVEEEIRQRAREAEIALQTLMQSQQAYQRVHREEKASSGSKQEDRKAHLAQQLAEYEAQADFTTRAVAWKIAEARLLEAVGIFARESGYPLPEEAWQDLER